MNSRVELGRERLVVRQHQRRPLQLLNDVRHRERLARAGDAHQHLLAPPVAQPVHQLANRLRLIAGGLKRCLKLEFHNLGRLLRVGTNPELYSESPLRTNT